MSGKTIRKARAALLALIAVPASGSGAPSLEQVVRQATAHGDVPAMAELYRHPPDDVSRALAAMALERIHFNLSALSIDAQVCERALRDSRPDMALFCAQFDNGNLRLARGAAVADAAEEDIIRRFAGKVAAGPLRKMQQYGDAHRDIPPMQVDVPAGGATIPLVHRLRDNRGALDVQANGHTSRLVMDTGAGPLVLDEETARRLGVRMLGTSGKARGLARSASHVRSCRPTGTTYPARHVASRC